MPKNFVALLKSVFAKLVGAHAIKPELVNSTFWSSLPAKFRARKPRSGAVSIYMFSKNKSPKNLLNMQLS